MTSLILLDRFYPAVSYRPVQKKKKATNYRVRFGHSLWSANHFLLEKRISSKNHELAEGDIQ